ncbi:Zinc finger FYVE domain-containing protein 9 [Balamuthia mandrillaris]
MTSPDYTIALSFAKRRPFAFSGPVRLEIIPDKYCLPLHQHISLDIPPLRYCCYLFPQSERHWSKRGRIELHSFIIAPNEKKNKMQKTACKEGSAAASGGPAPLLQRHDTATPQSSWMSRRMTPRDSERQENEHEGQNSKATATTTTATATARKESVTGRRPGLTLGSRRRTASREEDLPASSSSVTIKENANVTPSVQETAEKEEAAPGSTRRPSYSRNEADTSVEAGAEVRDGKLASNNNRSQTTVTQLSVRHGPSLSLGSGGTVADHLKTLLRKASEEGVTKLDLSSQGITHLPSEIKLPAETLEELNLESNFLQSLPYEIGSLHNLDSLFVCAFLKRPSRLRFFLLLPSFPC